MSKHFTARELMAFALPSIVMMVFASLYNIVDGLFISNFAGKTAFAAANFIMPIIMILSSTGFLIGTGGTAIVSATRGAGDEKKANEYFSLMVIFAIITGVILAIIGVLTARPICELMGASGQMLDDCVLYGSIIYISLPGFVLQCAFQSFMVAAGKPELGMKITIGAGVANIILDFILVGFLGMGLVGAAMATNVAEYSGGLIPLIYFLRKNSSYLRLCKTSWNWKIIGRTCINGSSEMVSNMATCIVSVCFNLQLMWMIGPDGVAAYGVIMYVSFIFSSIFFGFCMGTAPLMSYQYGAENKVEMRSLLTLCLKLVAVFSVLMLTLSQLFARPIAIAFCGYDEGFCDLTAHAFRLFFMGMLFCGFNIYGSSFFTSLNNGEVSATISFIRTLVLETSCVFILPVFIGINGVWLSYLMAEAIAAAITFGCIKFFARRYGYGA